MSWLFIHSAVPDQSIVGILSIDRIKLKQVEGRSHTILNTIAKLKPFPGIKGICVVAGPGSFTSIRTGVLIANLLAREWKLPLYGIDAHEAQNLDALTQKLLHGNIPPQAYVKPEYDTEPNITLPTRP